MPQQKILLALCGPNGSGKSTFYRSLKDLDYTSDLPFINADELFVQMTESASMPLDALGLKHTTVADFDAAVKEHGLYAVAQRGGYPVSLSARSNPMRVRWSTTPNGYDSAILADIIRNRMLAEGKSFAFETVMSHPGKIEFLELARAQGYLVELVFVCTDDVELNVRRVAQRVSAGGHDVREKDIRNRYERAIALLPQAIAAVDKALLVDTTTRTTKPIFAKKSEAGWEVIAVVPSWAKAALPKEIQ